MSEADRERIRMTLEDAVAQALEAGWTSGEVLNEVEYAIESFEDDA